MSHHALILFAHGARDPRWAEPFERVASAARRRLPGSRVQLAFLEFMGPDLRTAVQEAIAQGARAVDVVPMFLGAGGHVRRDLPALIEGLRTDHPHIELHLHGAIGEEPSVIEAMAASACESVAARKSA